MSFYKPFKQVGCLILWYINFKVQSSFSLVVGTVV